MNAPASPEHLLASLNANEPGHADPDPQETAEWREALLALLACEGPGRVRQMLDALQQLSQQRNVGWKARASTVRA